MFFNDNLYKRGEKEEKAPAVCVENKLNLSTQLSLFTHTYLSWVWEHLHIVNLSSVRQDWDRTGRPLLPRWWCVVVTVI